jgi:Tfp pilus assembly protein PilN
MSDISFLPEHLRGQEEPKTSSAPAASAAPADLRMHIPQAPQEEDVEILEVDATDLGAVLAGEPWLTRLTYRVSAALDRLKMVLQGEDSHAPPPKLPPQFFTPPKNGLVTKTSAAPLPPPGARLNEAQASAPRPMESETTSRARPGVRITPSGEPSQRVRVIRRVRKPVRVSLISAEDMVALSVDIPKRRWTLGVVSVLFAGIIVGGYVLLSGRVSDARAAAAGLNQDLTNIRAEIRERQQRWSTFQDLEQRLKLLNGLLANHVVITRLFDFLETRTLPEVSYRTVSLSPEGVLTLDVMTDSFSSAARQLVSFEQSPMVKRVDATAFTAEQDGVTGGIKRVVFQLLVTLDTRLLRGALPPVASHSSSTTASLPNP